ncbi:MAG: immunity 47 family protein [Lachnospiraceae bacterium]|jgi:hypothetical protein|nr:immunity 47 family protein [Lachnospiraceae bacterium]
MSELVNLMPGMWFGEKKNEKEISHMKANMQNIKSDQELVLSIVEILKSGDFSVKKNLIELMNSTKEENVLNLCIRVFCSIATHDELTNDNLAFVDEASDFALLTFASYAPNTLSYHIVPYLLALLEDWEYTDSDVEEALKDSLNGMLGYYNILGEDAETEEIGEYYLNDTDHIDEKIYYYGQKPVFPGELTKELVEKAYISLNSGKAMDMFIIPSLLSIWSGLKCPIEYGTVVDQEIMNSLNKYIDELVNIPWKKGEKYFYSIQVSEK